MLSVILNNRINSTKIDFHVNTVGKSGILKDKFPFSDVDFILKLWKTNFYSKNLI